MTFHELHHRELPLLLPNAWDVPSALAFAEAGFAAIGTTSFGVASAAGRPDGSRATRDANLALARHLAGLPVHLSVDIEDGYADGPQQVADYTAALGVAGVNIEDSTGGRLIPPGAHAAKVTAVKRRCPDLFVNARVDNFWIGQDATVEAVLRRVSTRRPARTCRPGWSGTSRPSANWPQTTPNGVFMTPGARRGR